MADHYQTGHSMIPHQGSLLIAPPGIPDPRFKQSVMLVTRNSRAGTLALCLNRHTRYTIKDVLNDTDLLSADLNIPLYWGGPVDVTSIWMLHSSEWKLDSTIPINEDWAITSNINMFYHLSDLDTPKHFRLMFGQASWAPGQLTAELRGLPPWNPNHSWLLAEDVDPEWAFEQPEDELWATCVELSGSQAVSHWL